jgi:DNA-binding response OmpR family regulator
VSATRRTLLVVDDERDVVDALRRVLKRPDMEFVGCTRPEEALQVLAERPVDLIISDLDMPGMNGIELLGRVRRAHPGTLRMVLTGRASLQNALEAINHGAVHQYLTKPWDTAALRATVDGALSRADELRKQDEAEHRRAKRQTQLRQLEAAFPGVTRLTLDKGLVQLDPARLDAMWSLRDALGDSPADAWLLDPPGAPASSHHSPSSDLEDLRGVVLDQRFRLDALVGSGGFGVVYRALQLSLDRPVAVKLLRSGAAGHTDLNRFRVEALAACQVVHPNAVTLLDAGVEARGLAYLVMELLSGETLAQSLGRGETFPFDAAAGVAADVCAALAVAHRSGILHRDIKPANVFLHRGPDGPTTKLLDFGIATLASATARVATAPGQLMGTPAYIAPERVTGDAVDGRADVYGVGVLLYEILSGVRPLPDASAAEMVRQQLTVHPRPLSALDDSVPPDLDALVGRMISKDKADRPAAEEAAAALREQVPRLPAVRMRGGSMAASAATTKA